MLRKARFGTSSMLPKIDAALSFLKAGKNRSAIITTMAKAEDAVNGKAGTTTNKYVLQKRRFAVHPAKLLFVFHLKALF